MVTPLARRRPAKVARETATLDRLSGGRLILGVRLGGDQFAGEFSKTGEQVDDRAPGEMRPPLMFPGRREDHLCSPCRSAQGRARPLI